MRETKRKKLEAAGWSVGSADQFLGLSPTESRQVAYAVDLRIPDGWALEPLERQPDYFLLSTPSPGRYMATLDFAHRGFRSGYSTIGRYVGETWNKPRKKYGGRGWKQLLVDNAIAHLQEVLR